MDALRRRGGPGISANFDWLLLTSLGAVRIHAQAVKALLNDRGTASSLLRTLEHFGAFVSVWKSPVCVRDSPRGIASLHGWRERADTTVGQVSQSAVVIMRGGAGRG